MNIITGRVITRLEGRHARGMREGQLMLFVRLKTDDNLLKSAVMTQGLAGI